MPSKPKKSSLADKISSLVTAAPTTFDSDDEKDETSAKLVEHDEDEEEIDSDSGVSRHSKFRKQNLDLLSEVDRRYEGKKVSRKTLHRNDSLSSGTEEDANQFEDTAGEEENTEEDSEESYKAEVSDAENDESEIESDDEPELEIDKTNPLRRRNKNEEGNFKHMSSIDVGAEIDKGRCVRGQLSIWENLLEMRIKLQKCLISGNQMPQYDVYASLTADKSFSKSANEGKKNLSKLLDNLLELQSTLLKTYPETKQLAKEKNGGKKENKEDDDNDDEEIPSDTEDEALSDAEENVDEEEEEERDKRPKKKRKLEDYETLISKNHRLYTSYRNSVIQKWNDKTRVAVGNVNNKGSSQPVVRQIEFILSDKSKLRKRTQLKRSEYEIVGKRETTEEDKDGRRGQEYDEEIYDDDDFYHQLLRELIEFKSADITDPIQLSKQWIQLQNMRSKMKRKIDTKATKGRRIRFGVHPKLVNFMAPITVNDQWTDEAKTELYNSLFGKIKNVEEK